MYSTSRENIQMRSFVILRFSFVLCSFRANTDLLLAELLHGTMIDSLYHIM